MKQPHESQPNFDESERFNQLMRQLEDPYVTRIHNKAREMQIVWLDALKLEDAEQFQESIRKELQHELDNEWLYTGKMIEMTGMAQKFLKDEEGRGYIQHEKIIGEQVCSNGFHIAPGDPRLYHHVFFLDANGARTHSGIIAVDDIEELTLPAPSPEARIQEFAYCHPGEVSQLDDIAFKARRDDQVIADLADFNFDFTPGDMDGMQIINDLETYVRAIAQIDPIANYKVTMFGELIIIDADGSGQPSRLAQAHTATVRINTMTMRPADTHVDYAQMVENNHWIPFVDMTILKPNGDNVRALVPCMSIHSMYNLRYNGYPKS